MRHLRLAVAVALVFAGAAQAKDAWKTITLRGEADFTIAVPTAAVNEVDAKNPDDLMFISVEAPMKGSLTCIAQRMDYPQGTTREVFAQKLSATKGEAFCQNSRAAAGSLSIGNAEAFDRQGRQGAVCTASFTDSKSKNPGQVDSTMVVAAASGVYVMTCNVEDEDQEVAEYEWGMLWGDKVRYMQESFTLPKSR